MNDTCMNDTCMNDIYEWIDTWDGFKIYGSKPYILCALNRVRTYDLAINSRTL